jgi:hypothetical protein
MPTRLAVAAVILALATPAAAADGRILLELEVGQKKVVGGYSGRCDDLSVATITLNEPATITALKPGTTICSARSVGPHRVYEVMVKAPATGG